MKRLPAFVSFAAKDARIRDLFVGQSRHPDTEWEIIDWSLHQPFDEKWKTQTRPRIARSGVVIVLIGSDTYQADGAVWEINCAKEEGVPVFGVWISKTRRGRIPPGLSMNNIISWTHAGIKKRMKQAAMLRRFRR